jgi:Family of unknown function (DUF6932)
MSLPEFTWSGELPLGVHRATLREVVTRFGSGPPQRVAIGERLERIHRLACETGKLARFVVFGSFVTDKPDPNDLDAFLIMDDSFDGAALNAEQTVLFDHAAADAHFGASIYWVRRLSAFGGEQATIEFWQTTRGGGKRGIVEIVEANHD